MHTSPQGESALEGQFHEVEHHTIAVEVNPCELENRLLMSHMQLK